jgi:hypothetical protein
MKLALALYLNRIALFKNVISTIELLINLNKTRRKSPYFRRILYSLNFNLTKLGVLNEYH